MLDVLLQAQQGLGQFLLVLEACPRTSDNTSINDAVLCPINDCNDIVNIKVGHPWLDNAISGVKSCIEQIKETYDSFYKEKVAFFGKTNTVLTWSHFHATVNAFEQMRDILNKLPLPNNTEARNPIFKLPYLLQDVVNDKTEEFLRWKTGVASNVPDRETNEDDGPAESDQRHITKVHKLARQLSTKILFTIQEIYKLEIDSVNNDTKDDQQGDGQLDYEENALVNGLHNAMDNGLKLLEVEVIKKTLTRLMHRWKNALNSCLSQKDVTTCTKLVASIFNCFFKKTNQC